MLFRITRPVPVQGRLALAAILSSGLLLTGCTGDTLENVSSTSSPGAPEESPATPAPEVSANVDQGAVAKVSTLVKLSVEDGKLRNVRLTGAESRVPGARADGGTSWAAQERLEPGTRYQLAAVVVDEDGTRQEWRREFRSQPLTLDEQTYASIAPLDGETVGIGMPVVVSFDIPVTDRARIERHLSVTSQPAQPGSWHWISDTEVHWRPKQYWKPGTQVTVDADINGVPAGAGIFGQDDRRASFTVGDAVMMKIDVAQHQMRVLRNGELLRALPISAGKPGFTTRSGVKVIIEKFRHKDMDAATTGISEDDAEYYDIEDVEYAQRVTYSGEFLHAAPWSVGSQGNANVSHGCVGMSTADAGWLYGITKRGDVVDVTGSDRPMEATNGFGDWNVSWKDYRAGSALS